MYKIGDRRVLFRKGEGPHGVPIDEYTGFEATDGGRIDVSAEDAFNKWVAPMVGEYLRVV